MSIANDMFYGYRERSAVRRGTRQQLGAMQEALDYLRQQDVLPQELREGALTQLGALYGLGGEAEGFDVESLRGTPIYESIMSGLGAGEESILRQAGATGGLRSGNVQDALSRYAGDLEARALMGSYQDRLQGLQGLAGLESGARDIAQLMAGQGQVRAAGTIAGERAIREGYQRGQATEQQNFENFMDLFGGIMGGGSGGGFSDERLKDNIEYSGQQEIEVNGVKHGVPLYSWTWNEIAEKLFGLTGRGFGTVAQRIKSRFPQFVIEDQGYYKVLYSEMGVSHG